MNGHLLFLVFFLIIFFVGMIVRGCYGRQSPDREKPLCDRLRAAVEHEGQLSFGLLILQAVFMIVAVVLYIFFTPQFSWLSLPFPEWLRWIGVILGLISLPFLWWIHRIMDPAAFRHSHMACNPRFYSSSLR